MAATFVHALDTRYKPARKVRVPEQHLDIFPYLKLRDDKKAETPKADTQADKTTTKGGK